MRYKPLMNSRLAKRAEALTSRAHRHLFWETYAPVLAWAALAVLLFVIAAASGLWQRIGDPWRLIALVITIILLSKNAWEARAKRKPNRSAARRRVETDNNYEHRPFDTVADTPALGHETEAAWKTHMRTARRQVEDARRSKLRPVLAARDPYYLRYIVPCALVLAAMVGAGDNYERLRASLTPGWIHGMSAKNAHYEAWIDPPQYTGRPPSYFKTKDTLTAPAGSEFVARISGVKTAPRLMITENGRTRRITAKRLGPKSFEARALISKNAKAHFRIGSSTKQWGLNIDQDTPPSAEFEETPEAGKRDRLIFSYNVIDDYGVENLSLSVALKSDPERHEEFQISLPGSAVRSAENEPAGLNLTKHKWANKEVTGYLVAVDGKGQTGQSEAVEFIVPDKIFVEPLAKAIAEQRVLMLEGGGDYAPLPKLKTVKFSELENRPMFKTERPDRAIERAPEPVQRAALLMDAITDKPVGVYNDPSIYMGLRNIHRHLLSARSQDDLAGVPDDLWSIALRAEFGRLGDAKADMQAAQRALNNAMARRAPQREIDALFDRYNKAVDRYMEELTLKAIENAKDETRGGDGESGEADFQTDEIQALLDAIEEANRIGDTVAARKALAQLAELLENMQIQMAEGGGGSGNGISDGGMSEEMEEALEELNDLLGEQRQLRDETQSAGREQRDGQSGEKPGDQPGEQQEDGAKSGQELAEDQQQLRELLDKLEDGAGGKKEDGENGGGGDEDGENGGGLDLSDEDIQSALKDAKSAMRESEDALERGDFFGAGQAQSDAIDALRSAGESIYAKEMDRQKQENGEGGEGGTDGRTDGNGNPFGQENDGPGVNDEFDLPEVDDRQRARDLLEQLRKRSGEQDRDKTERDFLERLLERF